MIILEQQQRFFICTIPGRPLVRSERYVDHYTNEPFVNKQTLIHNLQNQLGDQEPFVRAVRIDIIYFFPIPADRQRRRPHSLHTSRPTHYALDQYVYELLCPYIVKDRSLICMGSFEKYYDHDPRTEIRICPLK